MPLGKHPARHDPRTLQFANYLKSAIAPAEAFQPAPPEKSWAAAITHLGAMLNDTIGDCTCAAAGHLIQDWTANNGKQIIVPNNAIRAAYEAVSGYKPGHPSTDHGAVVIDVLNHWRKIGVGGRKIVAFASLEPGNHEHVKDALLIFGGVYLGVSLPRSAQTQDVWSVPPGGPTGNGAPGSWGGHAIPVVAYDTQGLTVITWGEPKRMTWSFFNAYCDEAYAVLSEDWLNGHKTSPGGFNLAKLMADLTALGDKPASTSTSAALALNSCRFASSNTNTRLSGMIFAEADEQDENELAEAAVNGSAGTEFKLPNGKYRYAFQARNNSEFDLSVIVNGKTGSCTPSAFKLSADDVASTVFEV